MCTEWGLVVVFFSSSPFSSPVNLAKLAITPTDKAFKYLDTSQPNGIKTENFQVSSPDCFRTAARSANERECVGGGVGSLISTKSAEANKVKLDKQLNTVGGSEAFQIALKSQGVHSILHDFPMTCFMGI